MSVVPWLVQKLSETLFVQAQLLRQREIGTVKIINPIVAKCLQVGGWTTHADYLICI